MTGQLLRGRVNSAQPYRSRTNEVWNLETGLSADWGAPRRSD